MNGKYLLKLNFSKEAFWQKVNLKLNSEGVQKYELAARRATEFPLELICRVTDHQVLHYFSIPQGRHTLPDTRLL